MTHHKTITEENRAYWTRRASGYSEVSRLELDTAKDKSAVTPSA